MTTTTAENQTVIGRTVTVRGNLAGDEDLLVEGRIEGNIDLQRTLTVGETGVLKADAKVRHAIVSGVVVGDLDASESVELTRECRMVGDIRAPRVVVADGAAFRGTIDMGAGIVEPKTKRRVETAPKAEPAAKKSDKSSSGGGGKKAKDDKSSSKSKKGGVPSFLEGPPKAKGLPKKKNKLVVKRR